jgi:fumarylacetoacetase
MTMPVRIGDFSDFNSSKNHAFNVGSMFSGVEKAILPNWHQIPVAYHQRTSSIVLSGVDIIRPKGQITEDF